MKGDLFLYPPDGPLPVYDPKYHHNPQNWSWFYSQWVTSFPYPRNIMWDFDKDPKLTPSTFNDPGYDVHYEGYDDPLLWMSDYVEFSGPIQYFSGRQSIGIDNTNGDTDLIGYVVFHINNSNLPSPVKHWYFELNGESTGDFFYQLSFDDIIYSGKTTDDWTNTPAQGVIFTCPPYQFMHWGGAIYPNPTWEEFKFKFYAPVGTEVYMDDFHIATECVPVPSAVILGGLGLSFSGWMFKRKRMI